MKKNCIGGRGIPILQDYLCSKFFLTMKATILTMLLTTLQVSASLYSQNASLTLNIRDKSLTEVIKTIEELSAYRFFYSDNYFELDQKVSINVTDKNIDEVLTYLLKEKSIDFRILDKNIIVIAPSKSFQQQKITGIITDAATGESLPGVNILIEGTTRGVVSDTKGSFSIDISEPGAVLVFSFVGYITEKVTYQAQQTIDVKLIPEIKTLGDVVVVGYGVQKKESVVGSITQTSGKVLERTGGVSSLGATLSGNLPGVITVSSSGVPGAEDPQIIIRTMSSWNNSTPLILVDGIERSMSAIDISSVETVSVLKDASATAVYGVKGANGVILITTKRGSIGKAQVQIRANATAKVPSKLPAKYDSYDALMIKNSAIENELPIKDGWGAYKPMGIIDKYRNPANSDEWDRYPNVDWEKELFKPYAMSYNASANISGGSKIIRYFASADFLREGDLFKSFDNQRGYKAGYGYNRINVRSNLDITLTKTTTLSTNLFGSNGIRKSAYGRNRTDEGSYWISAYRTAPDAMRPIYSNGMWGFNSLRNADQPNSAFDLAMSGVEKKTNTQINTDFTLKQNLDMFLKGLDIKATYALDNTFLESGRGINDLDNGVQRMWINPDTGDKAYETSQTDAGTGFDYSSGIRWISSGGSTDTTKTYRHQYYTAQLNYAHKFGKHDVTAMGLFSRDKYATGNEFPHYREDWVFRATYNYATKYFLEFNGAYNGSEQFGPEYRFAFFPSVSGGWMISREKFLEWARFIDILKLRASWGRIGDDKITTNRWLYNDQWANGGNYQMGDIPANTPYTYYRITLLGNPNISWETAEKRNFGVDYTLLKGLISGSVDIFNDTRSDILIAGGERAIPTYFGANAPYANLGIVNSHGYELELKLDHTFGKGFHVWANANMTHAVNKIKFKDDPELTPYYQKKAGYAINQTTTYINQGFLQTQDDVLGSTARVTNDDSKLVGDYNIIDYNGDGVIDQSDKVPYQYSGTPQNTYSASLGFDWKGLSLFVQFYGVNNVTREVTFPTFQATSNVAYVEGTYYSKNGGGEIPLPRWSTTVGPEASGTRYLFDGSYIRLKNAEIAYTFSGPFIKKMGMQSFKLYLNGDNIWLWTRMPDDRESNFSTNNSTNGAYPTVRRFNLGINLTF
jgi:TonB-linked SusC/RagA family outer membrane protein